MTGNLLIFGAHVRPAAFSALRAGFQPWCADLFADADLQARCPVTRIAAAGFPRSILQVFDASPAAPWLYAGGFENHPDLVEELARQRPLWGNNGDALRRARAPAFWSSLLAGAGIPCPEVREPISPPAPQRRWVIKPLASGGGSGIFWWSGPIAGFPFGQAYVQEFIEGQSCSAIFLGSESGSRLLAGSYQLIGQPWAQGFRYCGNIGPLPMDPPLRQVLERIGAILTAGCQLRGLWGLDFILRDGIPWPVEINPRYSSSIEVLEHATGLPALALHRTAFAADAPAPAWPEHPDLRRIVGKVVCFAKAPLVFPAAGPWLDGLRHPRPIHEMPAFADLPSPGTHIAAGCPVLTIFATGSSPADCQDRLRERLQETRSALGETM